jgi:hypothetical protein
MRDDDQDRLSGLIAWLASEGYDVENLCYRDVRDAAQSARIPAVQVGAARIWHYGRKDTPVIARALRLRKLPSPASAQQSAPAAA